MRIGVIGLRWDRTAEVVAHLAHGGVHEIVAVHEGCYDQSSIPERSWELLEPIADKVEQVGWDDGGVHDDLTASGWAGVVDHVADCDVVLLGRWSRWLEDEVARDALIWARDHDRLVIALEARSLGEGLTVRWLTRWAEDLGAMEHVRFTRGPALPLPGVEPAPWEWGSQPLDLRVVDDMADRLRGIGVRLAGRSWERIGEALGGEREGRLTGGPGTFELWLPDGIPLTVLASRGQDGRVDALRMNGDTDAFEDGMWPTPRTIIEVDEAGLITLTGGDVVDQFAVAPGTYVVQTPEEACAVQLYRIPDPVPANSEALASCPSATQLSSRRSTAIQVRR